MEFFEKAFGSKKRKRKKPEYFSGYLLFSLKSGVELTKISALFEKLISFCRENNWLLPKLVDGEGVSAERHSRKIDLYWIALGIAKLDYYDLTESEEESLRHIFYEYLQESETLFNELMDAGINPDNLNRD